MTTDFDAFLAPLDPPLLIVTTAAGGERSGCIVGFHAQCSIGPSRYALWLSKTNHTYGFVPRAVRWAAHVVTAEDRGLAELFGGQTGDEIDKFARCAWTEGPGGVPLLDDLPRRIVGRRLAIDDHGGDHVCVTISVDRVDVPGGADDDEGAPAPLRAKDLAGMQPGHPAD
jgi:flavin reductase (DIM6/NTAB) family NADH-FMN oxidoreductase RutF